MSLPPDQNAIYWKKRAVTEWLSGFKQFRQGSLKNVWDYLNWAGHDMAAMTQALQIIDAALNNFGKTLMETKYKEPKKK